MKSGKSGARRQAEILESRKPIVEGIVALMEKGGLEWTEPIENYGASFNPVSGARYRGANRLRICHAAALHGWTDPRYVTFAQAKAAGWSVGKGEHGVSLEVWKPVIARKKESDGDEAVAEKGGSECEAPRSFMRCISTFTVFNAEQVRGMPAYEAVLPAQADGGLVGVCDMVKAASPCRVVEGGRGIAFYDMGADFVSVFDRSAAGSLNTFVRVLLHEEVHATGHRSRLARDMSGDKRSKAYAWEELVAELGAAFLAAELGLPRMSEEGGLEVDHAAQHAAYLSSWAVALKQNPDVLFVVAAEAEKAAGLIAAAWREEVMGLSQ